MDPKNDGYRLSASSTVDVSPAPDASLRALPGFAASGRENIELSAVVAAFQEGPRCCWITLERHPTGKDGAGCIIFVEDLQNPPDTCPAAVLKDGLARKLAFIRWYEQSTLD